MKSSFSETLEHAFGEHALPPSEARETHKPDGLKEEPGSCDRLFEVL